MLDLKIEGGTVIDGTGTTGGRTDVGISDDTIVAIGDLSREPAGKLLHAAGKVVAPGFIDMHSHSDWRPVSFTRQVPTLRRTRSSSSPGWPPGNAATTPVTSAARGRRCWTLCVRPSGWGTRPMFPSRSAISRRPDVRTGARWPRRWL